MLTTILIVVLLLALIGSMPVWPYSSRWGYYPTSGLGVVLLVLVLVMFLGPRPIG